MACDARDAAMTRYLQGQASRVELGLQERRGDHRQADWRSEDLQESRAIASLPLVGTVFENTNYPLPVWFEVIYLICQSKKGMSAMQVQRMLTENGRPTAYKTAFYICHRVRAMLDNPEFRPLMGQVEVDETYIGGKDKNRHWDKKAGAELRHGWQNSSQSARSPAKGNVVCKMIENADTETLTKFVRKTVSDKVELVATDEHSGYRYLKYAPLSALQPCQHSDGEYVRGDDSHSEHRFVLGAC